MAEDTDVLVVPMMVPISPLPDTRLAVRADAGCASLPRATCGDDIRGPAARRGSTL